MAWETRNGRGRYYTRSVREGGRVRRYYLGSGPLVAMLAEEHEEERRERARQRAALDTERRRLAALDAPLTDLCRLADALAAGALLAAGYRRHERGHWRKRRERDESAAD